MTSAPAALEEWRDFARMDPTPRGLQVFHAEHKLELLAHDEAASRALGRIVAQARPGTLPQAVAEYGALLARAMAREPTRGTHANALSHLAGHVRDRDRARALAARIDAYRRHACERAEVLDELRTALAASEAAWALRQSYLRRG